MEKILANRTNYGGARKLSAIKYIVIHYTANKGDTAKNNALYFRNNAHLNASAHIFVDDKEEVLSVPLTNVAWSVGGRKYPDCEKTGGGRLYGKATNANTLNIELCGTDGYKPNAAEKKRALNLTKKYMKQLGIPASRVIRHFDVTGKSCPAYWTDNAKWNKEFHSLLTEAKAKKSSHTFYTQPGYYKVIKTPRPVRSAPNTRAKINSYIVKNEVYTVTEVSGIYGKLKSGAGYICLRDDYVKKVTI